jgi:hypothetical protein
MWQSWCKGAAPRQDTPERGNGCRSRGRPGPTLTIRRIGTTPAGGDEEDTGAARRCAIKGGNAHKHHARNVSPGASTVSVRSSTQVIKTAR